MLAAMPRAQRGAVEPDSLGSQYCFHCQGYSVPRSLIIEEDNDVEDRVSVIVRLALVVVVVCEEVFGVDPVLFGLVGRLRRYTRFETGGRTAGGDASYGWHTRHTAR